jgi:hypothetical protein
MNARKTPLFPVLILSIPLSFISAFFVFFAVLFILAYIFPKGGSVVGLFSIALTIPISIIIGLVVSFRFLRRVDDD